MEKLQLHTKDLTDENIEKIGALFPSCITEKEDNNGKLVKAIDFDVLKDCLSKTPIVSDDDSRYTMLWPGKRAARQLAFKSTTNTLRPCPEESVNFENTENLYIEGDNLEVLKLLRETYLGKVKMIYIDPPYNTGNDFIYNDDFRQTTEEYVASTNQVDEKGNRLVKNTESGGRFHSDWLNMMYSRLLVARDLLSDDGVIFISIDDNEVDNLKKICCEIFGEFNFIGCAGRITKKSNNKGDFWAPNFDYLLTFAKNKIMTVPFLGEANESAYNQVDTDGPRCGEKYQLVRLYMSSIQNRNPEQRFWIECPDGSKVIPPGKTFPPERPILGDGIWRWSKETYQKNIDKIVIKEVSSSNLVTEDGSPAKWNVFTKTYLNDVLDKATAKPNNFIENHINQNASHELNALGIPFDYAKPASLIKYLMSVMRISTHDIVLDFFSGSGTTADSLFQYNNEEQTKAKFILIQIPELCDEKSEAFKAGYKNICEIGKERIRRAGKKICSEHLCDKIDTGFRVLKVDSSNTKDIYYKPEETQQRDIDGYIDNLKEDRSSFDLLFQVMLELGIPLDVSIKTTTVNGLTVYNVAGNSLIACFDKGVNEDLIKEMAKQMPLYAAFRDVAYTDDSTKINVEQIFKQLSKDTKIFAI